MNTAPKDGTKILGKDSEGNIAVIWFCRDYPLNTLGNEGEWIYGIHTNYDGEFDDYLCFYPVEWKSLTF